MLLRNAIQLAYGVPGILTYPLVFYGMFGVRNILSRSFIVIFSLMAASNITTWLNAWVYLKLTNESFFFFYYEWLKTKQILVHIHSFLIPHFYYVQNIDLFLLTFDRFMAILSIGRDTTWWKKYYLAMAIIIQTVALVVHLISRLPLTTIIYLDPKTGRYDFQEQSGNFMKPLAASMQLGFGIFVFLCCSILNILSLRLLRKLRNNRHASVERSFLFISFCIFLSQAVNVFVACLIAAFHTSGRFTYNDFRSIYEIMFYTSDLFSLGPAFIAMTTVERLLKIQFNATELASIITDEEFDHQRAGRWMDDHMIFCYQAIALYVIAIFSIKNWMRGREPMNLRIPVAVWNLSIAVMSGLRAAAMTAEYFDSTYVKGFNASLCSTREDFFTGANGFAVFVYLFTRLTALLDTIFIVLRKQHLLFFHWYHHALTLFISWFGYSSASPSSRHAIYFNVAIHTVLYSYFFLHSLNLRPPRILARWLMMAEIVHFFFILYALCHLTYIAYVLKARFYTICFNTAWFMYVVHPCLYSKEPCQIEPWSLVITWVMDLSYLYLFIDFVVNGKKKARKAKKME